MLQNASYRPSPADFEDYRAYLKAMVAHLKTRPGGFSQRQFARRAGYSTTNFLSLVMEAKRGLNSSGIVKFARGLGLSDREHDQFEALVLYCQAESDSERNRYYTRFRQMRRSASEPVMIEQAQYDVYSMWWALAIHQMMLQEDFREDPVWISKRLFPQVSLPDVKKALEALEKAGLVERIAGGILKPTAPKLATPPTVRSLAVRNFHRAMLENAAHSLDALPVEERNVTSLTLNLSRSQYEEFVAEITRYRAELLDRYGMESPDGQPRDVYSVGIHVVPLTRREKP